ncbi:MAG TPA: hypothetical protein VLJ68_08690, partial [Chitinophagaceae bacterium]|nr:hypothetical protein [Chitinophagaceae bacterium]
MIPSIRKAYNAAFTKERYEAFLKDLSAEHPCQLDFRVAETPVFVPRDFTKKMLEAAEHIVDVITHKNFKERTKNAIPGNLRVPGENDHSHFIAFDFGICINEAREYEPQLIEMQGFPSLFAYEVLLDDVSHRHFPVPPGFSSYLQGYDRESYLSLLKEIITGNHETENAILLEIFPKKQKTRIDFFCTEDLLGVPMVCLTELIQDGRKLYYEKEGRKILVKRIYNRVIFDDLQQQTPEVQEKGKI